MAPTCAFESRPIPRSESEIAVVTTTANVIVKFRRRPIRTSLRRNLARMIYPLNLCIRKHRGLGLELHGQDLAR